MVIQLVRALWGAALLLAPSRLLYRLGEPSAGVVRVTRILGARHLAEAVILRLRGDLPPPRWSTLIDGLHAASMMGVAIRRPRLRRDALVSASAAVLLAGATELQRRRAAGHPPR